ncbi:integrase [Burkholderia multivorans]|uniref:tyrosine-type recombinase/integrase n=1 Tax=Burkholderia multivorans TaxID=87883 RepID=UPI000CFF90BA|nr:tyrosine-type recombinase/integrase [Burkholderia multivorans]PRD74954.1 integrase [Burkholderia multivorans]
MPKLDISKIRAAKPEAGKDWPIRLSDGNGLHLELKSRTAGVWRYRFELNGKAGIYTIGDYPAIGIADARRERERVRALVKQGRNPVQERRTERAKAATENAHTFEVIAREWLASRDWQAETKARRLDMLTRVVFPTIGKLPVKSITSVMVLDVLKRAASENGPSVAAEARRTMSSVFELAIATLRAETDPVYAVRKAIPPNKTQHKRPLTIDEIGQLMRDLAAHADRNHNIQTVTAFRLMWWTLCRPNEAVEAQWSEFDLETGVWRITADRMKMRAEHVVPLPRQAVEALRSLHAITGNRKYTFPHSDDRERPMAIATLRQMLKTLGWAGKYSPHATRTTGSTHLNEMGYASDWIERQLAHAEPNSVRRTYNHAKHFDERARMMQAWADMLDALRDGAKVIPGKFGRAA